MAWAGVAKLVAPAPAEATLRAARLPAPRGAGRFVGAGEVGAAVAIAVTGARPGAAALALVGLALALVAERARRRAPGSDCGCFGAGAAPVGAAHVLVDLGIVAVALAAVASPPGPLLEVLGGQPLGAAPFVGLVVLATVAAQACLTALPAAHHAARTGTAR